MNHAKRLGIFGGSFDPPHIAHLALARHAVEQFHLNELRIIPTGDAWHKTRTLTPSPHRLAMTRLAFAEVPQATLDRQVRSFVRRMVMPERSFLRSEVRDREGQIRQSLREAALRACVRLRAMRAGFPEDQTGLIRRRSPAQGSGVAGLQGKQHHDL
mgnify:CR=1 FL=1